MLHVTAEGCGDSAAESGGGGFGVYHGKTMEQKHSEEKLG